MTRQPARDRPERRRHPCPAQQRMREQPRHPAGRDPRSLVIYNLQTVILDETDEAAEAKFRDYRSYASYDGALVFMSGWTAIDFGQYAPTDIVRKVETDAVVSLVDAPAEGDPEKTWTVDELAAWSGIGGVGPVTVGSPATVADILQQWVEDTDVDGFNLAYAVTPETFEDVADVLVPELQRRGADQTEYAPGTLREKLFSAGARLPADDPGAGYRNLAALRAVAAQQLDRSSSRPRRRRGPDERFKQCPQRSIFALAAHAPTRCTIRCAGSSSTSATTT
jgi:long-chain alkane monooxygenase